MTELALAAATLALALLIVLTSGYSADDVSARFGGSGSAGFVQKPFMPSTLVRTVREALRSAGRAVS